MGLPRATVNKTPLRTEEAAADNEQQVYGSRQKTALAGQNSPAWGTFHNDKVQP
jgi:hypothetical protein